MVRFSLVSTVFNERKRLQQTIDDIEAQIVKPDQVVITDAGSTDGTFEYLNDWANKSGIEILILQKHRCNVAEGRNLAIRHARYDLIVSTDFGCRFHRKWLQSIVTPFEDSSVKAVGGAFGVEEGSIISTASRANYVLTNGYRVDLDNHFIPSSRSIAYYKHVWQAVGGYCEWLTLAADDLVFGKAVLSQGYTFFLVKEPYVLWGRHESLKGYAKEAFRYGLGDGEARVNLRNTISTIVEMTMRLLLGISLLGFVINALFPFANPASFLLTLPFIIGLRSYYRSFKNWLSLRSQKYNVSVLFYSFFLIEVTRINYIRGFVNGYFFSSPVVKKEAKALTLLLK